MSRVKQLATHTLIYGFSTVLVRALNWLISPFHTYVFQEADFGTISEMYAYVAFLNVVFMYGMETAFFRFASKQNPSNAVFSTAFLSLLITTISGVGLLIVNAGGIANLLHYPQGSTYVVFFALIIGFDTLSNIPFAKLRLEEKSIRYVSIKAINVLVNILLNFLLLYPIWKGEYDMFGYTVNPQHAILYVFAANLTASILTFLIFIPELLRSTTSFDKKLFRKMMSYSWPFIITGLAGMVNETLDRILLKFLLPGTDKENLAQLGIYSAAYKLSIFMNLLVQAFRLGAEPFFFKHAGNKDAKNVYADVMYYFVFIAMAVFLVISLNIDWIIQILGEGYRTGKNVVPIILMAYAFLGIFYNLSVWYKLTDKTHLSIWISLSGAAATILFNVLFIPVIGYWAAAWATLLAYTVMTIFSYVLSRKYYAIPYPTGKIIVLILFAVCLFGLSAQWNFSNKVIRLIFQNSFLFMYLLAGYLFIYKPKKAH